MLEILVFSLVILIHVNLAHLGIISYLMFKALTILAPNSWKDSTRKLAGQITV